MKYFIGFLMTLNDREMPFYAEICFLRPFDWILLRDFRDDYVKANKATCVLSATEM